MAYSYLIKVKTRAAVANIGQLVLSAPKHAYFRTREHTITAFWDYLLFLELCYKVLEKDQRAHLHDHILRPKYNALHELYYSDRFVSEGDFAERLLRLLGCVCKIHSCLNARLLSNIHG